MADDTSTMIGTARHTLRDCQRRWDRFRQEAAQNVTDYVNEGFDYLQSMLDETSGPRQWLKDGVAVWFRGVTTARALWRSAFQAVFPGDEG